MTKQVKDKALLAKSFWYSNIYSHIHDMQVNPWLMREYICIVTGGKTAHHKKSVNMTMQLPDGTLVSNSCKNMAVFGPHFKHVFSNHQPVNLSILDLIPQ
jgi:hypothetical protein